MPLNAVTACVLGGFHGDPDDVLGGALTAYLILTGWMAVRRRPRRAGVAAKAAGLGAIAGAWFIAVLAAPPASYGAAGLAALAGAGDLSVALRGGISGAQRIARHLWRLHLGFFIAVGSFFPGQLQLFPQFIQQIRPTALLFAPPLSVLALMIFWLARVYWSSRGAPTRRAL